MDLNSSNCDEESGKSFSEIVTIVDHRKFSPPSNSSKDCYNHVVIVGDSRCLLAAFNWDAANEYITFFKLQDDNWKCLSNLAEQLPSKTLWMFLGDVNLITERNNGNSKFSALPCSDDICSVTELMIKICADESVNDDGSIDDHYESFVQKQLTLFKENLTRFITNLPIGADIILFCVTPIIITKLFLTKQSHKQNHKDLRTYPDLFFTRECLLDGITLTELFAEKWKKMAVNIECSSLLQTIVEKSLVFPEVSISWIQRKMIDKVYQEKKGWFCNIWNIINIALGSTNECK